MAFVPGLEEEEENQGQPGGIGVQPAQPIAPGVGSGTLNTGGAQQQAARETRGSSGRWTNLNQILDANREQADQFGGRIAGNVQSTMDQAEQGVTQAKSEFADQAQANTVRADQGMFNQIRQDPTKVDVQAFSRIRDAEYGGPMSLSDIGSFGEAQGQFQRADRQSELAGSEQGRATLVRDQFGRPDYTRGQNQLDQLLLQNSPGARQQLGELRPRFQGLSEMFGQKTEAAQRMGQEAQAQTQAARDQARGVVSDERGRLQSDVENRVSQMRQRELERAQMFGRDLDEELFNQQTLESMGLKAGQNIYDLNLRDFFIQGNPEAINAQNVASQDDFARYAALSELAGVDPQFLYDQSQAGLAGDYGVGFDRDSLSQMLQQRQAAEQAAMDSQGQLDIDEVRRQSMESGLGGINAQFFTTDRRFLPFVQSDGSISQRQAPLISLSPRQAAEHLQGIEAAGLGNHIGYRAVKFALQNIIDNHNNKFNPSRTVRAR